MFQTKQKANVFSEEPKRTGKVNVPDISGIEDVQTEPERAKKMTAMAIIEAMMEGRCVC